jgi:hypothetical protein
MSKFMFPQTPATDKNFNRTGGLTFRELAAIEICAQMSGALVFSNLDDHKKAKNLAAAPTMAVELAEALERALNPPEPVYVDEEKLAELLKKQDDPGGKKARSLILLGGMGDPKGTLGEK